MSKHASLNIIRKSISRKPSITAKVFKKICKMIKSMLQKENFDLLKELLVLLLKTCSIKFLNKSIIGNS